VKLYFDTIGDEVTKLDPELAYIDSSPANGPFYTGANADGTYSKPLAEILKQKRWGDAQSPKYGDGESIFRGLGAFPWGLPLSPCRPSVVLNLSAPPPSRPPSALLQQRGRLHRARRRAHGARAV
jgi:hypothetical protein